MVLLVTLILSLCIDISLGAPNRSLLKKAEAKSKKLAKKAAVSDIKLYELSSLRASIETRCLRQILNVP